MGTGDVSISPSTAGTSESVVARPAVPLRGLVGKYSGYRQIGVAAGTHRGLPSPYLTVIVTFDEPLTIIRHPDARLAPDVFETLVGGLHASPALIAHQGRQAGIQLAVHPLAARALLGVPAGEIANLDVSGTLLLGPLADEVRDRVGAARDWPGRFAAIDAVLLRALGSGGCAAPPPAVGRAWSQLRASRGTTTVADLAADVGWSSRHLAARFEAEIGLSPKIAARVVRFDRARRLLGARIGRGQAPALADLAAVCGYYDQAHLARDFRALAGCAPSRWAAEEFRNVQAGAAPDGEQ